MADIFISYSREDRAKVASLAAALESRDWSVWWDRQIVGGSEFSEEIERELTASKAVVVAWSKHAVKSRWVKDEAAAGAEAGKLVPVSLDGMRSPMGFRQYHAINIANWKGDVEGPEFHDVARAVEARLTGEVDPVQAVTRLSIKERLTQRPLLAVLGAAAVLLTTLAFFVGRPNMNAANERAAAAPIASTSALASRAQRFLIELRDIEPIGSIDGLSAHVTISRDGSNIVYAAQRDGMSQLYLRPLDQLESRAIEGAHDATHPFFAPDNETVAFAKRQPDELRRISTAGGTPVQIAEPDHIWGADWSAADKVVFGGYGLFEVSSGGGNAQRLTGDEPLVLASDPKILPGGDVLLFTLEPSRETDSRPNIAAFHKSSGEIKTLVEDAFNPRYVPSGHLVFARAGTLWAAPFDPEKVALLGAPAPVIHDIQTDSDSPTTTYAVSDTGVLVYVRGGDLVTSETKQLLWIDRTGKAQPALAEERRYLHPRLSPDGAKVAISVEENGNRDIWVYDLETGAPLRLTFDAAPDVSPLWTPDGKRIAFSSNRDGGGMYIKSADGAGTAALLTSGRMPHFPEEFSPDGEFLVYREERARSDLHLLTMKDGSTRPLAATEKDEDYAAISPDGRWIAHEEDGVVIRPFPNVEDGKWQLTGKSGDEPHWGPKGRELFYRESESGDMMVAPLDESSRAAAGPPLSIYIGNIGEDEPTYDIAPDGERILIARANDDARGDSADASIVVVTNWFDELNRLAPAQ